MKEQIPAIANRRIQSTCALVPARHPRPAASLALGASCVIAAVLLGACRPAAKTSDKPVAHIVRDIHGWRIHIDQRLLNPSDANHTASANRALSLLERELGFIAAALPKDCTDKLREIPIWLDQTHGELRGVTYHPDKPWLTEHGYSEELWRCVQVTNTEEFCDPVRRMEEPLPLLHQLIHGFEDRAMGGFEDPGTLAIFEQYKARHGVAQVVLLTGETGPHPALKRPRELFMEMSLAYFGLGRYAQKTAEDLLRHDPEIHEWIRSSWQEGKP